MTAPAAVFIVTASTHPEGCEGCQERAEGAAISARATGSVGGTGTMHRPDSTVEHSATVSRIDGWVVIL